jgi:hypothetical protein
MNDAYKPEFYRLNNTEETARFDDLVSEKKPAIYDEIDGQLRELIKSLNPSVKLKAHDYPELIAKHINGQEIKVYGVWVYYPWTNRIVHLLDEEEFIEVRTNRNRYKITREEQQALRAKKIGIIGLSVGQSIALTLAMERVCGELRLADFDTAELSNLNRIRTGVHNLGQRKTIIAAREIMEIDPFLKVKIFNDGLTSNNIDDFFLADGKLDMLVEVCDGLDIKIISRFKARELRIPVIMDTNDRGMLDVERFDLEPERPILHGLAGDLDPDKIKDLSNEDKVPYILKMVGTDTLSTRLKASMMEVEQSINTWPQLASSVTLGGAITTDVARRVLLDQFHGSGRYYVDLDEIVKDEVQLVESKNNYIGPAELNFEDVKSIAEKYTPATDSINLGFDKIKQILVAACAAPSGGNAQPWKFLYKKDRVFIIHDAFYSYSLLDINNYGSYIAFGAMLENIEIKAAELELSAKADVFPVKDDLRLVAVISFEKKKDAYPFKYLAPVIGKRLTNRNVVERQLLNQNDKDELINTAATVPGAMLKLFDSEDDILRFADVLTNAERIRFLNEQGHYDTFIKELRFTREQTMETADGLDVDTLNMSNSDKAALMIAKDPEAIKFLNKLKQGTGFKKISAKAVMSAGCMGVLCMNGHEPIHFLQGGRAVERVWLEANSRNISFQPITQIVFMLERYANRGRTDFNEFEQGELAAMKENFEKLVKLPEGKFPIFVFRLLYADPPKERSLRRSLDKVLFVN